MADILTVGGYDFFGGNFHVQSLSFPPPVPTAVASAVWRANPSSRNWPHVVMHEDNNRVIDGYLQCATEALARAELGAITSACVPGATIVYQPDGESSPFACSVLVGVVSPGPLDVTRRRMLSADFYIDVTVSLVTTPYWAGPLIVETLTVPATTPWVATITGVNGDVPALTEYRYLHAQAVTSLALGIRSNPGAGFLPTQDYAGNTGDAMALGGDYAVKTNDTNYDTIGTPATLAAADMAGDFLVLARCKGSGATVAQEFVRARSSVAGPIGAPTTFDGTEVNPVSVSDAGYDVLNLGVVPIPAGRVQTGRSGGGWAPEVRVVDGSGWTCASHGLGPQVQTFAVTNNGRLSAFYIYVDIPGWISVVVHRGGLLVAFGYLAPDLVSAGRTRVPLFSGAAIVAGETLTATVEGTATIHYAPSTSQYAGGARTGGGDIQFDTYEQATPTFGGEVQIQARASTGTPTMRLDTAAFIPTDEGAVYVPFAAATTAGQGIDIDYLSENDAEHGVYLADASYTGTSLIAAAEPYGAMLLRPGDNAIVGAAETPKDAAPGNATLIVTRRERYLIPCAYERVGAALAAPFLFNDFSAGQGLDTGSIGTVVYNNGTVNTTANANYLTAYSMGTGYDAAIFKILTPIATTAKLRYTAKFRVAGIADGTSVFYLTNNVPICDDGTIAGPRIVCAVESIASNGLKLTYSDNNGVKKSWKPTTTAAWNNDTTDYFSGTDSATTDFTIKLEIENNGGAPRWRFILCNAAGAPLTNGTTDWVAFSATRAFADGGYIAGGSFHNYVTGYNADVRYSFIKAEWY